MHNIKKYYEEMTMKQIIDYLRNGQKPGIIYGSRLVNAPTIKYMIISLQKFEKQLTQQPIPLSNKKQQIKSQTDKNRQNKNEQQQQSADIYSVGESSDRNSVYNDLKIDQLYESLEWYKQHELTKQKVQQIHKLYAGIAKGFNGDKIKGSLWEIKVPFLKELMQPIVDDHSILTVIQRRVSKLTGNRRGSDSNLCLKLIDAIMMQIDLLQEELAKAPIYRKNGRELQLYQKLCTIYYRNQTQEEHANGLTMTDKSIWIVDQFLDIIEQKQKQNPQQRNSLWSSIIKFISPKSKNKETIKPNIENQTLKQKQKEEQTKQNQLNGTFERQCIMINGKLMDPKQGITGNKFVKNDYNKMRAQIDELRHSNEVTRTQYNKILVENKQLKKQLTQHSQQISNNNQIQSDLSKLKAYKDRLQSDNAKLQSDNKNLQTQLTHKVSDMQIQSS